MVSPIWQRQLCADPKPLQPKVLIVDGVTADALTKLLALSYGTVKTMDVGLAEILDLLSAATRLELFAVRSALEDAACGLLTLDNCGSILAQQPSPAAGASRLVDACRDIALGRFDDFAATPAFLDVDEDLLFFLLGEDELHARSEEAVLDATVRWMTAGGAGGAPRGARLLARVRFPLMDPAFLAERALHRLPGLPQLEAAVREAVAMREAPADRRRASAPQFLEARALAPRVQVRRRRCR